MDDDLTRDAIFNGRLTVVQPGAGYRFSIDSLLLADFALALPGRRLADLGAGVGVVGLAMAAKAPGLRVLAVEIQPRLAECARLTARANPDVDLEVLEMDWSELDAAATGGPVDYVVSNPPYRGVGSGRMNPDGEEARARHELQGSLVSAAEAAAALLKKGGRFTVVFPAARLAFLLAVLRQTGFEPKRMRMIHSRPRQEARLVMVEARLGAGEELTVGPPLYVFESGGIYSAETEAILSGSRFAGPANGPGPEPDPGR